jgi:ribonuclease-3
VTANRRADAVAVLQAALGYTFKDQSLLERALTHASVGDGMAKVAHNERLEFLGDRVLGLIAADALMTAQPDWQEGQLTRRHATLVNGQACARVARRLDIGPALRLAVRPIPVGARTTPSWATPWKR